MSGWLKSFPLKNNGSPEYFASAYRQPLPGNSYGIMSQYFIGRLLAPIGNGAAPLRDFQYFFRQIRSGGATMDTLQPFIATKNRLKSFLSGSTFTSVGFSFG
jgi:hypothetical protein